MESSPFNQIITFISQDRTNVILMGDNEGDCCVLKALGNVETSLKIGFLNDNVRFTITIFVHVHVHVQ